MKYYLIHGIDTERKPFMEDQFRKYGIPSEDVKWLTHPNKDDVFPEGICSNPELTRGMISCTYKHYLALKDICDNEYPLAIIMEDNISFNRNVPDAITRYLRDLPEDWDVLFDSDFYRHKFIESPVYPEISVYKKSNDPSYQCSGSVKGAHFILINLNSARKIYSKFFPIQNVSDWAYNWILKSENMNVYWAEPPNVHKILRKSTWMDIPSYNMSISKVYDPELFNSLNTNKILPFIKFKR